MSVYKALIAAGCEVDHWQSDLYVKDTPESREIIARHGMKVGCFRSSINGTPWLELPFQYDPYWEKRVNS